MSGELCVVSGVTLEAVTGERVESKHGERRRAGGTSWVGAVGRALAHGGRGGGEKVARVQHPKVLEPAIGDAAQHVIGHDHDSIRA